ncbi:MAG TPA: TRAP transporter substrate-binding protein DctP [Polyangia bacterium]|nr:TRAP transporter substrate-binding protein DctP [Polyangia bacterium]
MRTHRLLALALALPLVAASASAEEKIKLGTLAPNGSPWHTLLKEMGQKWSDASGGKVKLIIYPGGVVGNEGDMVKKMRIGQMQAAALTTIGLHDIAQEPQALDVPMMIDTAQTLDFVLERMQPQLEKVLLDKGYVVIGWSDVGFVRFFSTKKMSSMKEFESAKVFSWEGDPASVEAWRAGGFHPVVASSTDILPSLQTGLIDTVALVPVYAFGSRVFERAKYMLDLPWAALSGATVVKKEAWDKVPPELRPKLLEIAREYGGKISAEVRRMDADALKQMKQQGLVVVAPADVKAFQAAAERGSKVFRGKVVPEAIFDEVKQLVEEAHRQSAKR